MSAALPSLSQSYETERIYGERAVAGAPMEMRTGHPARRTNEANLLSASDGVAGRDESFAQVEISGDDTGSVIDVHDVAGEKESVHQRDYAAVCREYRRARCALEIDAEVTACHSAIEHSAGTEAAGDA